MGIPSGNRSGNSLTAAQRKQSSKRLFSGHSHTDNSSDDNSNTDNSNTKLTHDKKRQRNATEQRSVVDNVNVPATAITTGNDKSNSINLDNPTIHTSYNQPNRLGNSYRDVHGEIDKIVA